MTNELMISLLDQANTGAEMLNVLDAITGVDTETETVYLPILNQDVPTLEEIAF
jgi:hypothetical protein